VLNKPAGIVARLQGAWLKTWTVAEAAKAAENLAYMHCAASEWKRHFPNPRCIEWRDLTAQQVRTFLTLEQNQLLDSVLESQHKHELNLLATLPQGAIHADYFHDNVLFNEGLITGVIDFGFAGCDAYAYDLAIAVNDWCWSRDTQSIDLPMYQSYMRAYQDVRPLNKDEKAAWGWLLQRAALRFWLSRLFDLHCPREGAWVHAHDPMHFERVLRYHHEAKATELLEAVLND
jgi:homoserine kinase type II